jgi:hypothetical protein
MFNCFHFVHVCCVIQCTPYYYLSAVGGGAPGYYYSSADLVLVEALEEVVEEALEASRTR